MKDSTVKLGNSILATSSGASYLVGTVSGSIVGAAIGAVAGVLLAVWANHNEGRRNAL
jgi:hypothetical protein